MSGTPLAIDLFCGLFGWGAGFVAEGYRVVGFDLEKHGPIPEGCELVLQDVLTLHGSQFRNAAVIVASPPCQAYSYRAMPWKRAKALPPPSNELFDACFRIQREASEAAGRHIPMVIENVAGAQRWVGRAKWHYGSYYLWGDVPALMPWTSRRAAMKTNGHVNKRDGYDHTRHLTNQRESDALKVPGFNFHEYEKTGKPGRSFQSAAVATQQRLMPCEFCGYEFPEELGRYGCPNCNGEGLDGIKGVPSQLGGNRQTWFDNGLCKLSSRSNSRKAASAQIAKIPFELAQYIAAHFKPNNAKATAK